MILLKSRGFTLLEMIVAVAIVGILATICVASYYKMAQSISQARCLSNLKALHPAFAGYVTDKGYWPQPPDFDPGAEEQMETWWLTTMDPYTGGSKNVWLCPVLKAGKAQAPSGYELRMHYVPSLFDAHPSRPYQWPRHPWLSEAANAHGDGPLILFTDGSVQSFGSVMGGGK